MCLCSSDLLPWGCILGLAVTLDSLRLSPEPLSLQTAAPASCQPLTLQRTQQPQFESQGLLFLAEACKCAHMRVHTCVTTAASSSQCGSTGQGADSPGRLYGQGKVAGTPSNWL